MSSRMHSLLTWANLHLPQARDSACFSRPYSSASLVGRVALAATGGDQ